MNDFLKHHRVDVGRSLALLAFFGAVTDTIAMIVGPAFTDKVTLNFGPISAVWIGCALWMRRPWARKLLIGFGWLAAFCILGATIRVAFFGDINLTFYGTTVTKPTVWHYVSLLIAAAPLVYVLLRIVHSEKFREEVYPEAQNKPIQPA